VTDRRSLEVFSIWFGFLVGTILWILIGVSGVPLSLSRVVIMFGAAVFNFGSVARALRLRSS
jgi:Na+/H+ antiporter NhaA